MSQSPHPASQLLISQLPVAHEAVAFGSEQAIPQPPQLVSVVREVSQPSPGTPLQFP
jgi:hypothetical protein